MRVRAQLGADAQPDDDTPSQVLIRLMARDGSLCCTVSDDGAGYDPGSTAMGSGQRNMADRLAALDGKLEITSCPGKGTIITARLRLPVQA